MNIVVAMDIKSVMGGTMTPAPCAADMVGSVDIVIGSTSLGTKAPLDSYHKETPNLSDTKEDSFPIGGDFDISINNGKDEDDVDEEDAMIDLPELHHSDST